MIQPGIYRHYKGQDYEVLHVCLHTETREPMVHYRACYDVTDFDPMFGTELTFVRPYDMFTESVQVKGQSVPRFTPIA